ncbi:MAG: TauD/TfdA family dioxygenase [Acidimicrobiia bacterium]|nr:TauD/TfdA family dioxygenase [Acidimicrobiia bacterium]
MEIERVTGALGAEIRGADLAALDDDGFAQVQAALLEHLVVFFPDQDLTPDEHRAFAVRFGEPEIHPFIPKLDNDHQEIVVLDSDKGAKADVWHTDVTFSETPPLCSVLKMVTTPSFGGDTMWTNQYLAYEGLSAPMRDLLDGLTAVHSAWPFGHPEITTEHPAVRVHPETGRRSLFVNRQFTSHFPQLRRSESDALLGYLCAFSEQPQFVVRYRWSEGAVGVWDNRCTQHHAVNDYDAPRVIHRVTILGDTPQGNPARWPAYESARGGAAEMLAMLGGGEMTP